MSAREIVVQVAIWAPVSLAAFLALISLPNFFTRD